MDLHYFTASADAGNFFRAANMLAGTKSALSRRVRAQALAPFNSRQVVEQSWSTSGRALAEIEFAKRQVRTDRVGQAANKRAEQWTLTAVSKIPCYPRKIP
jgi:hypothetical protein